MDSFISKIRINWSEPVKPVIKLNGYISRIINNLDNSNMIPLKYYHFPTYLDIINYILVYTDFIENQYFGDTFAPILKIVPVKAREESQLVTYFDNPHYVPIKN